jgi:plasmid maintenance system antidote protein VapI
MTERFWMNLQTRYELEVEKDRLGSRLDAEVHRLGATRRPAAENNVRQIYNGNGN